LADSFFRCFRENISSSEASLVLARTSLLLAMSSSFRAIYPPDWSTNLSTGEIMAMALSERSLMVSLAQSSLSRKGSRHISKRVSHDAIAIWSVNLSS